MLFITYAITFRMHRVMRLFNALDYRHTKRRMEFDFQVFREQYARNDYICIHLKVV